MSFSRTGEPGEGPDGGNAEFYAQLKGAAEHSRDLIDAAHRRVTSGQNSDERSTSEQPLEKSSEPSASELPPSSER